MDYTFIATQLTHWLSCPANGYLGSDYGIDLKQYMHKPMSQFNADWIIAKMKADIPILAMLPENSVNIHVADETDGKHIYIQVMERVFLAV